MQEALTEISRGICVHRVQAISRVSSPILTAHPRGGTYHMYNNVQGLVIT